MKAVGQYGLEKQEENEDDKAVESIRPAVKESQQMIIRLCLRKTVAVNCNPGSSLQDGVEEEEGKDMVESVQTATKVYDQRVRLHLQKPYLCLMCSRRFPSRDVIDCHMNTHLSNRQGESRQARW